MNPEIPFIDLASQYRSLKDELTAVLSKAIDEGAYIGGEALSGFEKDFADLAGCKWVVGVGNGTDALRLAMMAMGIGPGSRVVTVPNTFIATTEAITQTGAQISFVDVDPDTSLMCPNLLEDFLKKAFAESPADQRPTAILPVHLYGQCADMDSIQNLAGEFDLPVLEDAAQAHGATYKGRPAGSLATAGTFSFYPAKNLGGLGEAGAVTTNDPNIAEKVRMLRDHGQKQKHLHEVEGFNSRLDSIQAGFLSVLLRHLSKWNEQRRMIANRYDQAFSSIAGVRAVNIRPENVPSRHLYVIHVSDRDKLADRLKKNAIGAGLHYPIPLHLQPCYKSLGHVEGNFLNTEKLAAELLSLPIFPGMTEEQADRVIKVVESF
ncbi:MAG: DegT/DnrJ/EryC1/StrS family aminotransferase [Alphaproteobacteria bacterium]|nr:DegT/DnrJ/EryC1/StrS family aminotransferase [Alphaproteobacteria bacterium]